MMFPKVCGKQNAHFTHRRESSSLPSLHVTQWVSQVYLWHGTQVRKGLAIAQDDFKLSFAGSTTGSMFGEGLYFAESCTKADEYAKDDKGHLGLEVDWTSLFDFFF